MIQAIGDNANCLFYIQTLENITEYRYNMIVGGMIMLKDVIESRNESLYSISKNTGVPYSTLCDVMSGKTSVENMRCGTLNRLSKYFELSMDYLYGTDTSPRKAYIYNEGRYVHLNVGQEEITYMGPRNLIAFKKINKKKGNMLYIDTFFSDDEGTIYVEEDFVDLGELASDYNNPDICKMDYVIGKPNGSKKISLIDNAILVSDNLAINYKESSTDDVLLEIIDVARDNQRMVMRLFDCLILETNMSKALQKRAIEAVERNKDLIQLEIEEIQKYA